MERIQRKVIRDPNQRVFGRTTVADIENLYDVLDDYLCSSSNRAVKDSILERTLIRLAAYVDGLIDEEGKDIGRNVPVVTIKIKLYEVDEDNFRQPLTMQEAEQVVKTLLQEGSLLGYVFDSVKLTEEEWDL